MDTTTGDTRDKIRSFGKEAGKVSYRSDPPTHALNQMSMASTRYKCSLLIVDDEPAILALLVRQLGSDFDILTATTAADAKKTIETRSVDIVLTDLTLPDASGMHLLDWVYQKSPRTARVLITGTARLQDAVDAINCCHVHRLILKPWRGEDLLTHMRDVSRTLLLERSHERLLEELRTLNSQLEQRVQERTHDLKVMNQILEKMALTDPLTNLPNRRAIDLIARKELLRRSRVPMPIAIGLIDADRFKQINTNHLLSGGDHVLTHMAKLLQRTVRATDAVGRVGGEEFLVVAPDTEEVGALRLSERLRTAIEESSTEYNGQPIPVTISLGFAVAEDGVQVSFEQLRELAATALSEAKAQGRNCSVIKKFNPSTS